MDTGVDAFAQVFKPQLQFMPVPRLSHCNKLHMPQGPATPRLIGKPCLKLPVSRAGKCWKWWWLQKSLYAQLISHLQRNRIIGLEIHRKHAP